MPATSSPFEAVLHAARDVAKLDCALDAEMLGTALLGSVYSVAEADRATAVREFVAEFLSATTRRRTASATTIREVFAALVPDAAGAAQVRRGAQAPSWTAELGRVRPTGCYAYGDVYGDQTSYLVTFAYENADGGPEHAVVALVDHNIGITKDVFVGSSAERILQQVREMCAEDELTWFREEDPGRLRDEVDRTWRSPTGWARCRPRARWPPTARWPRPGLRCCRRRRPRRWTSRPTRATPTWPATSWPARKRPGSGWRR